MGPVDYKVEELVGKALIEGHKWAILSKLPRFNPCGNAVTIFRKKLRLCLESLQFTSLKGYLFVLKIVQKSLL